MPSEEPSPYEQGKMARASGDVSLYQNPYRLVDSDKEADWDRGWKVEHYRRLREEEKI